MTEPILLLLNLNEKTRVLSAHYTPPPPVQVEAQAQAFDKSAAAPGHSAPTLELLQELLKQHGWSDQALDEAQTQAFLQLCSNAVEPVQQAVGAVHDGRFEVRVMADNMSAMMALWAPQGGLPITLEQVQQELAERGIVHGIQQDLLRELLEQAQCPPTVIAQGTPAVPGLPTRFESLLDALQSHHDDDFDENATVDYRNLGKLLLVSPGTPLMRRTLAIQGLDGMNVLGLPVPPLILPDTPFASNLKGVVLDETDPQILCAAIAGVPLIVPHGIEVSPIIEVDAVDLSTGNINFDGSLQVKGDITSGMEVRVTGDVVVAGTIEAALVEAGGNVSVNGGIIGTSNERHGYTSDDDTAGRLARVICGGDVKARFIEHAVISAGKSVNAEHQIRQSNVHSGERVTVGAPGDRQGVIAGGSVQAMKSVSAGTLGSTAGLPTTILAGINPRAHALLLNLDKKRLRLNEEIGKLEKILAFLKANPAKAVGDLMQRTISTYQQLQSELVELDAEKHKLQQELQPLATATVTAALRFCGGITLQIGNKVLELMEDQVGGKASVAEGHIVIRAPGSAAQQSAEQAN